MHIELLLETLCVKTGQDVKPPSKPAEQASWPIDQKQFADKVKKFFTHAVDKKSEPIRDPQDLLKHNFIVGEAHQHISPKSFLIHNMLVLKKQGYEVLFMEHLFYDQHQAQLDQFHQTGEMPPKLKEYVKELDSEFGWTFQLGKDSELKCLRWEKFNFTAVIYAAQQAGIRVVAIDIALFYEMHRSHYFSIHQDRHPYMNYAAFHIIQHEAAKNPSAKWCALMGNTHATTYKSTIGLAQLFGVNAVLVSDDPTKQVPRIAINTTVTLGETSVKSNVLIEQHPDVEISIETFAAKMMFFLLEKTNGEEVLALIKRAFAEFTSSEYLPLPVILEIIAYILDDTASENLKSTHGVTTNTSTVQLLINSSPLYGGNNTVDPEQTLDDSEALVPEDRFAPRGHG